MKTNNIDIPHQPAKRRAIKVSAAILAGVFWLGTQPALQAQPNFTRITTGPLVTDLGSSFGGTVGDYDGDGYLDLFVNRYLSGRSSLYQNNGNGTFVGVTNNVSPVSLGEYSWGFWADFDNNGGPDLFMTDLYGVFPSYFAFNNGGAPFTKMDFEIQSAWGISMVDYDQDGLLDIYLIAGETVRTNRFYRNLDGHSFAAVSRAEVGDLVGLARTYGTAAWADYDDDGWLDVFAANLANTNRCQMYHNDGHGRFVSVTNQVTRDGIIGVTAGWGDYDNDGRVDLCVGSLGATSYIYRNLGEGNFVRASIGVTLPYASALAWGDYDNDGFLDLLMTGTPNRGGCSLFRNNGNGTFTQITSGVIVTTFPPQALCYSGNWFDYDNDGFLDLFVANGDDIGDKRLANFLFHNDRNSNAWLKVKLVGSVSNRDAVGAKVRVKATFAGATRWQRRDMAAGDNFGGNNNPIAHFGLGDATNVETLRVEWPSGQVTELNNLAVRQQLTITEEPGMRVARYAPGDMQIELTAHVGMNVELRVTNSLPINFTAVPYTDWPPWKTVLQTNRTMTVTDPEAGQYSRRFYGGRVQ